MKIAAVLIISLLLTSSLVSSQEDNTLTSKEMKQGWVLLFDGTSMSGWTTSTGQKIPDGSWEVSDGCLNTLLGDNGGDIITLNEYSDFVLSVDFKLTTGCNSGVKYFFTNYKNGGNLGCEYQLIDDKLGEDAIQANHRCGAFYDVLAPNESKKMLNPPGEWNNLRIVSEGKKVEHWLNNIKILEYTRGDRIFTYAVKRSKFSKVVPPFGMVDKGHILLQHHGGVVSFKNIKIRVF